MKRKCWFAGWMLFCQLATIVVVAQVDPNPQQPLFTDKLLGRLDNKSAHINERLDKQTTRYLTKLMRQEERLKRKLYKIDSTGAKRLFDNTQANYQQLISKMNTIPSEEEIASKAAAYLPYIDSIKNSLRFLDKNKELLATAKSASATLEQSLAEVNLLQSRLQQTEQIQAFIKQRKQLIGEALKKYTQLPKGIANDYNNLTKEVYYYQAQVRAYKEILNDPSKMEQKALRSLNKIPAFATFMKEHSYLAEMFRVPDDYGTSAALAGLQTRAQVQQLMDSRISSGGPNAQSIVQANLQSAQSQLSQLKDKINQLGGGSTEIDMPNFKPNEQKTKTFLQRLEYSTNLQTVKSDRYFPTTSDISLNIGYKLNDKSIIGVGSSYKLGLGKDIRHIAFSHQGVGIRSFIDYKIKGSFWFTGGTEMNYRSQFDRLEVLKDYAAWQQSALIGVSKKYKVSRKVKGNAQLLYDALWKQQVPRNNAILFRIGYHFNK